MYKKHLVNGRKLDVKKALSKEQMAEAEEKKMRMQERNAGMDMGRGGGTFSLCTVLKLILMENDNLFCLSYL